VIAEQLAAITAMAKILEMIGSWPVGTVLAALFIGPWLMSALLSRAADRRHAEMARMYENNVELLRQTQEIARQGQSLAQDLKDYIVYNTEVMSGVKTMIENNLNCPVVRERTRRTEAG